MFQKSVAIVILIVVTICSIGCSSITQKRKASEQPPEIVEEDIDDSTKSRRSDEALQDALPESSGQAHKNGLQYPRIETPSQDIPEGSDSAINEPEQQAPRRLIWKGSKDGGKRWAPVDQESSQ